jgi:hypothetical protein
MLKYNQATLAIEDPDALPSMLRFLGGLTNEEHNDMRLVLLSDIPKSVLSYYTKWSYFIAEYASLH